MSGALAFTHTLADAPLNDAPADKLATPGARMRYYFNLVNCEGRIPDMEGVEAASPSHAQEQALKAIEELRSEDEDTGDDWAGWRLEVIDGSGHLIMFLDLGKSAS